MTCETTAFSGSESRLAKADYCFTALERLDMALSLLNNFIFCFLSEAISRLPKPLTAAVSTDLYDGQRSEYYICECYDALR